MIQVVGCSAQLGVDCRIDASRRPECVRANLKVRGAAGESPGSLGLCAVGRSEKPADDFGDGDGGDRYHEHVMHFLEHRPH